MPNLEVKPIVAKVVFNTDTETYDIMYGEEVKLSLTPQEWWVFGMSVDGAEDTALQYDEARDIYDSEGEYI